MQALAFSLTPSPFLPLLALTKETINIGNDIPAFPFSFRLRATASSHSLRPSRSSFARSRTLGVAVTRPHTPTHASTLSPSPLRAFAIPLDREPASELRPFPEITTVSASHLSYNGHIEGTYSPPFLVPEIWERDKGIEK